MISFAPKNLYHRGKSAARNAQAIALIAKQGFLFIDVPRTSSSSIKSELAERFGPVNGKTDIIEDEFRSKGQLIAPHKTARKMRKKIGGYIWKQIYTFSVVRNPWDRYFSVYCYRQKTNKLYANITFEEYVRDMEHATADTPGFQRFQWRYNASDFLTDENGDLLVDKVVKYEERREGLREVGQRIGFPELGQAWAQRAKPEGTHYSEVYTDEMRDIIARHSARDIELFGYEFSRKA